MLQPAQDPNKGSHNKINAATQIEQTGLKSIITAVSALGDAEVLEKFSKMLEAIRLESEAGDKSLQKSIEDVIASSLEGDKKLEDRILKGFDAIGYDIDNLPAELQKDMNEFKTILAAYDNIVNAIEAESAEMARGVVEELLDADGNPCDGTNLPADSPLTPLDPTEREFVSYFDTWFITDGERECMMNLFAYKNFGRTQEEIELGLSSVDDFLLLKDIVKYGEQYITDGGDLESPLWSAAIPTGDNDEEGNPITVDRTEYTYGLDVVKFLKEFSTDDPLDFEKGPNHLPNMYVSFADFLNWQGRGGEEDALNVEAWIIQTQAVLKEFQSDFVNSISNVYSTHDSNMKKLESTINTEIKSRIEKQHHASLGFKYPTVLQDDATIYPTSKYIPSSLEVSVNGQILIPEEDYVVAPDGSIKFIDGSDVFVSSTSEYHIHLTAVAKDDSDIVSEGHFSRMSPSNADEAQNMGLHSSAAIEALVDSHKVAKAAKNIEAQDEAAAANEAMDKCNQEMAAIETDLEDQRATQDSAQAASNECTEEMEEATAALAQSREDQTEAENERDDKAAILQTAKENFEVAEANYRASETALQEATDKYQLATNPPYGTPVDADLIRETEAAKKKAEDDKDKANAAMDQAQVDFSDAKVVVETANEAVEEAIVKVEEASARLDEKTRECEEKAQILEMENAKVAALVTRKDDIMADCEDKQAELEAAKAKAEEEKAIYDKWKEDGESTPFDAYLQLAKAKEALFTGKSTFPNFVPREEGYESNAKFYNNNEEDPSVA